MGLPAVNIPTDEVTIGNETVKVRGLSRAEALNLQRHADDLAEVDVLLVAYGTDTPIAEVREWLNTVPADAVEPLTLRVAELSGLVEDAARPTNAG